MDETKVLGISGKKSSGKNTVANYILGCWLKSLEIVNGSCKIRPNGQLWISDIFGDEAYAGIFDITSRSTSMLDFRKKHLDEIIRIYSFADLLKEVCIKVLGLTHEQCYGCDDDKNTPTNLKWENMPGVLNDSEYYDLVDCERVAGALHRYNTKKNKYIYKKGQMTAREVMQFVGTEIFRKMQNNVWVDALLRQIQIEKPLMAIVTDVRFTNEVNSILSVNKPLEGNVIRLTRNIYEDEHASETALDGYTNDKMIIVNNHDMSIQEQNDAVKEVLIGLNWFPHIMPPSIQL